MPRPDISDTSAARVETTLASRGRMAFGLISRLAVADLWHERMLTTCVTVALTAVLAPLLILFSLKYGLVETLRTRLVNDPRNREIRPELGHTFTHDEIEHLRRLPGVRFVVPNTRSIASSVDISLSDGKDSIHADILPTGPGDPLLLANGVDIPDEGGCVLSHRAWKALAPQGGTIERILIEVGRTTAEQKREVVSTTLAVIGVVAERATDNETVFTPLEFLEKIESWRDGREIPSLGWPGGSAEATGVTDRVIVAMPRALDAVERSALPVKLPWASEINELNVEDIAARMPVPQGSTHFYELGTNSKRLDPGVDEKAITALRRSLPEVAGGIFAQCRPINLEFKLHGKELDIPFQVEPALVNEPVRRKTFIQPRPAPDQQPAAAQQEPPVPKAIPVSPPPTPQINLQQPKPLTPPFDLSRFQKQLTPPPPPVRKPEPKKPGDEPHSPAAPKNNKLTPNTSTFRIPWQSEFRYIAATQTKKNNTKPVNQPVAKTGAQKPASVQTGQAQPPAAPEKRAQKPSSEEVRHAQSAAPAPGAPAEPPVTPVIPPAANPATRPEPAAIPPPPPAIIVEPPAARPPEKLRRELLLPVSSGISDGTLVRATFQSPFGPVSFPAMVKISSHSSPLIPQSLAGVLRLGMDRGIAFEESTAEFVLSRRGYPALRVVAHSIDDVEGIASHFNSMQVGVMTAAARIRDVKELDRYTSYVFLLVAAVGLTGAVGSLLASLIAAVERKRRSLGVLRLLGLRRRTLFRLPLYQGAIVVSLSVGLSVLAWRYVTRIIIQITTASDYLNGETIQTLPSIYLWAAWGGSLVVAAIASIIAGFRVMRVNPSEAIRDE